MKAKQNVIMIHIGRCGSTALARMLMQHTDVSWSGELFWQCIDDWERRGGQVKLNNGEFQPWLPNTNHQYLNRAPYDIFSILGHRMHNTNKPIFGFELKFYHLRAFNFDFEIFMEYLERIGFNKIIFLTRKNTLNQVISYVRAKESGKIHLDAGAPPNTKKINLSINNIKHDYSERPLIEILENFNKDITRFRSWLGNREILELNYETHIEKNPEIGFNEIIKFIGIPNQPQIQIKTARATPFPASEVVLNFNEVEKALQGSAFEWMTKSP